MSIWRSLAIVVLVSCSGAAAPKSPPLSTTAPPGAEAANAATGDGAEPRSSADDPVCARLVDADPGAADADADATDAAASSDGDDGDGSTGRRRKKLERISACSVARVNFTRDAEAILAARGRTGKPAPRTPWDHKTRPERLDLIRRRFELAPDELAQLSRTGVVVPARLTQPGYAYAYHEIFQSQLPVYITADSVFHAIFASHDAIVEKLERASLAPALGEALDRMHCALAAATAYPADTVRDLDLYLTVARSLASRGEVHSMRGDAAVDAAASDLVAKVHAAAGAERIALFGRDRLVDFTAYTPRGHYTSSEDLTSYFLAAMWT